MIVHGHVQNTCDRNNAMFMRVFKLYRVTVHSNKPTVLKTETSSMFRSGREKQIGGTNAICGQKNVAEVIANGMPGTCSNNS
jgi:hypothetical protein